MLNWWHVTCLHPEESACNFFLHSKCQVIQASFPVHRSGTVVSHLPVKDVFRNGLVGNDYSAINSHTCLYCKNTFVFYQKSYFAD